VKVASVGKTKDKLASFRRLVSHHSLSGARHTRSVATLVVVGTKLPSSTIRTSFPHITRQVSVSEKDGSQV
jgi:hypothetical protein